MLANWVPIVMFAFLFGISMDYEVFILARIREEYDRTGSTPGRGRPSPPSRTRRAADDQPDCGTGEQPGVRSGPPIARAVPTCVAALP